MSIRSTLPPLISDTLVTGLGMVAEEEKTLKVIQELFGLALSTEIPINTCCPPRHFLAIEDWSESWQDPEGSWKHKSTPAHRVLASIGSPIRQILKGSSTKKFSIA